MNTLDLPVYSMTFEYLTDKMIESINKQLMENFSDAEWYSNLFNSFNLSSEYKDNIVTIYYKVLDIVTLKLNKKQDEINDLIQEEVIKYIRFKQICDALNDIN